MRRFAFTLLTLWSLQALAQKEYNEYKPVEYLYQNDFETHKNYAFDEVRSYHDRGYLVLSRDGDMISGYNLFSDLDLSRDFEMEMRVRMTKVDNNTKSCGFVLGDFSDSWNVYRINFSHNSQFQIKSSIEGQFKNITDKVFLGERYPGNFNIYTVREVGNKIYTFANGRLYHEERIKEWLGNNLKLRVEGGMTQIIDYVNVAYIAKGQRDPLPEFKDQEVRDLEEIYQEYIPTKTTMEANMESDNDWKGDNLYLDRGELMLQVTKTTYEYLRYDSIPKENFQLEAEIRVVNFQEEPNHGIKLYTIHDDWDNNEGYYFLLYPNNTKYRVVKFNEVGGEYSSESLGTEALNNISENSFNKLTIRKVADTVSFFVNERQALSLIEKKPFKYFSIRGEYNHTSSFDNIKISEIKSRNEADQANLVVAAKSQSSENYKYHTGPFENPYPFPRIATDNTEYKRAKEAYDKKNYDLSKRLFQALSQYYPESGDVQLYLGLNHLQFQEYDQAYAAIKTASIIDPADINIKQNLIILEALTQKSDPAYANAKVLAKMVDQEWFNYTKSYMTAFKSAFSNFTPAGSALLGNVISYYQSEFNKSSKKYFDAVDQQVFYQLDAAPKKYAPDFFKRANNATRLIVEEDLPNSIQHVMMLHLYEIAMREAQDPNNDSDWQGWFDERAIDIYQGMWTAYENNEVDNPYIEIKFSNFKYNTMVNAGDYDNAISLNGVRIDRVKNEPTLSYTWYFLISERALLLSVMGRTSEAQQLGARLLQGLQKFKNPEFQTQSYIALSNAYQRTDGQKALDYALKAEKVINDTGFEPAKIQAYNRISIAYFQLGNLDKSAEYAIKSAEVADDPLAKAPNYTSVAVTYEIAEEFDKSIEMYLKAEDFYMQAMEEASDYGIKRAYQLLYQSNLQLANVYAKTGKDEEAFNALERANSLQLSKSVSNEEAPQPIDLKAVQQLLKPDQAMLYYAKHNRAETSFMMFGITKDKILSRYISSGSLFVNERNKYADSLLVIENKFAQNEMRKAAFQPNAQSIQAGDFNLLTEHLRKSFKSNDYYTIAELGGKYYDIFVGPFEELIKGKNDIIVVPSATLGFLPFEGLLTPESKLMVELYDISYIQSPTIWKTLQERDYGERPKSILAMGGANYAEPNIQANLIKSYADVDQIRYRVFDGIIDSVSSFRQAWADLGHLKHNYLPGTKREVETIKQLVPSTELLLGNEMTESRIKAMSQQGTLDDYEVLHFATHGWVENFVPALSGLTMSIFPNEENGEDGHIYLHEASQLKLKADMVMLSACQTALGKAQVGEGVAGLNQAFLTAGANSTVVSLWSVNDYATSILASEMYRLRYQEGMSFNKALNQVKRNFINGKYNTEGMRLDHPQFWAPFVYYGKTE